MSPVLLSDAQSVGTFHRFVFADTAARAPYIYGLELRYFQCDPLEKQRLVALLAAATRLQYLSFSITFGDFLITAVGKKTTLRELSVFACFDNLGVYELLSDLHSPLRHLRIEAYGPGQISASCIHEKLAHFAPTLEVLQLEDLALDISPSDVKRRFSSLRSLEVESISGSAQLDVLLQLFPNLDGTLVIRDLKDWPGETHLALRERNKEAQATHAWPQLDHVVCSAAVAFVMALQCPIRRMDITPLGFMPWYLVDILHQSCPQHLHFYLSMSHSLIPLNGVLPPGVADRLTHLVMFFDFDFEHRPPSDPQATDHVGWHHFFMDMLANSVDHLRLTHLRIIFYYRVRVSQGVSTCTQPQPTAVFPEDFVSTAREGDLHPAATMLLGAIPTLEYVFLTTCGASYTLGDQTWTPPDKWLYWKAWRVVRLDDEANGSLVELSAEEIGTVIVREELQ